MGLVGSRMTGPAVIVDIEYLWTGLHIGHGAGFCNICCGHRLGAEHFPEALAYHTAHWFHVQLSFSQDCAYEGAYGCTHRSGRRDLILSCISCLRCVIGGTCAGCGVQGLPQQTLCFLLDSSISVKVTPFKLDPQNPDSTLDSC